MFEFTNEKPSSDKIWEELNKQNLPSSGGIPTELIKTMMWVLLNAGTDFKKSKESAAKVVSGETSPDKLRKAFRTALLSMKGSTPLDVNPTDFKTPDDSVDVFNDVPELKLPIMIFKDIFKNSDAEAVIALAARVFPVSPDMEINLRTDITTQSGDYSVLTAYGVSTLDDEVLFGKANFRKFFQANTTLSPVEVKDKKALKELLRTRLTETAAQGQTYISIPTFTKAD